MTATNRQVIRVYQDEKLYSIEITLEDDAGDPVNLTGNSAVTLKVQQQGEDAIKFTRALTVTGATTGVVSYTVQDGHFDEVGNYFAEIQVDYNDGKLLRFNNFIFNCLPKLPKTAL